MSTLDKKSKRRVDWPAGIAALSLAFTGIFVGVAWAWSMDFENIVFSLFGFPISFSPIYPPVALFALGMVQVIFGQRGEWFWKPAVTGCVMSFLYIAIGVVIFLTKLPIWLLGMLLISLLTDPIISQMKKSKKTINSTGINK